MFLTLFIKPLWSTFALTIFESCSFVCPSFRLSLTIFPTLLYSTADVFFSSSLPFFVFVICIQVVKPVCAPDTLNGSIYDMSHWSVPRQLVAGPLGHPRLAFALLRYGVRSIQQRSSFSCFHFLPSSLPLTKISPRCHRTFLFRILGLWNVAELLFFWPRIFGLNQKWGSGIISAPTRGRFL